MGYDIHPVAMRRKLFPGALFLGSSWTLKLPIKRRNSPSLILGCYDPFVCLTCMRDQGNSPAITLGYNPIEIIRVDVVDSKGAITWPVKSFTSAYNILICRVRSARYSLIM